MEITNFSLLFILYIPWETTLFEREKEREEMKKKKQTNIFVQNQTDYFSIPFHLYSISFFLHIL